MKKNKKKAFTLAELLIVVIVIGILAGLGIPKMRRVLETRKTTEAEEALAALRTEQEKNCIFKGAYQEANKLDTMASIQRSKNYSYGLEEKGAVADAKGSEYALRMPSYQDGRICCTGDDCSKLNKNYPSCADMVVSDDGTCIMQGEPTGECINGETDTNTESCGICGTRTQERSCENGSWGSWGAWSACADSCECTSGDTQTQTDSCGCNNAGTRTRIRTCADGSWGSWGAWSACSADDCECTNGQTKEEGTRPCDCDGTETQKWICQNGHWVANGWTECSGDCHGCEAPRVWNGTACVCPGEGAWYASMTNTCCLPSTPKSDTNCWRLEWDYEETAEDHGGYRGTMIASYSYNNDQDCVNQQEPCQCSSAGQTCTAKMCFVACCGFHQTVSVLASVPGICQYEPMH